MTEWRFGGLAVLAERKYGYKKNSNFADRLHFKGMEANFAEPTFVK